jgi:hypothetical protein
MGGAFPGAEANAARDRWIFHSPMAPADAFRTAREQLRTWLQGTSYDLSAFDRGDAQVGAGAVLVHGVAEAADGSQTQRWQLDERGNEGTRTSSLTVHAPAEASGNAVTWFWVEGEFAPAGPESGDPPLATPPRLISGLLTAVPAYDSVARLTDSPLTVDAGGTDALIDILCEPDRRLPAVVASAHPEIGFTEWRRVIGRMTRDLPGLASIYLMDAAATQAFGEAIGATHAVWGGALRTYMPDVDPAVADEALRHRVMSAARIAADPDAAAAVVSALPRRLAAEAPLPAPLAEGNRTLLAKAGGTVQATEGPQAQVTLLASERDLALNLAREQEERANALFAQRQSALAEITELEQRVLYLESQVKVLQERLISAGNRDAAFWPIKGPALPPGTFAELLDWLDTSLRRVTFTGDIAEPLTLDQRPESSTWVRSSWEVLRAMQSYANTKAGGKFTGDFKVWCEKPPSGAYGIPSGKVVRDESETVRKHGKWRRQREFPVPADIDPAGRVFMGAHVRIGASAAGRINPRLYFHDATARFGMMYVGYLGRHLSNTRS